MIINDASINTIEDLIYEGIVYKNRATEGKKIFINKVLETLSKIYDENKLEIPNWINILSNKLVIGSEIEEAQDNKSYHNDLYDYCLRLLEDLRSNYHLQMQLEESKKKTREAEKQTHEAQKQTKEAERSNNTAHWALLISMFAVVVSIFASVLSMRTHVVRVDDTQYDEIKSLLSQDSIVPHTIIKNP